KVIDDLKQKAPDILVLSIGAARTAAVLPGMVAAGVTPALFLTGRIDALPPAIANTYPNAIYQLAWDRLPEADNDRVRKLIGKETSENWIFEGRKIPEAPGWRSGECKPRPEAEVIDPLEPANLRAIGVGTQFADMIALIAAS